jgi:hypothetical protein
MAALSERAHAEFFGPRVPAAAEETAALDSHNRTTDRVYL